jgi:hypothetical protein
MMCGGTVVPSDRSEVASIRKKVHRIVSAKPSSLRLKTRRDQTETRQQRVQVKSEESAYSRIYIASWARCLLLCAPFSLLQSLLDENQAHDSCLRNAVSPRITVFSLTGACNGM